MRDNQKAIDWHFKIVMQFEWDESKNLENIRKHKMDFTDVPEMFEGSMLIEVDDRIGYGEDRWIGIAFCQTV